MSFRVSYLLTVILLIVRLPQGLAQAQETHTSEGVSFKRDVFPIIHRACLPCHADDNFNPSQLSLDSYDLLRQGGKHGPAVVPGKPSEGTLVQKLTANPPFGDRMPLDPKKKKGESSTRKLSDEEIELIREWVEQGANDN